MGMGPIDNFSLVTGSGLDQGTVVLRPARVVLRCLGDCKLNIIQ